MKPIAYEIISISLSVITFGIIFYLGLKTDILRESIPNVEMKNRMFSLGRFQLWIWTLVVCPIFILFWGYSAGHAIDLNTTAVILLGIPAGVAVTSNVISSSQSGELSENDHMDAQVAVQQKKATTQVHTEAIAEAANADPGTPRTTTVPPTQASKVLKMHQVSKSFFIDLISDDSGQLSLGRLQQLIFTIAFLVIYVSTFFSADLGALPVFEAEVFALMGISSGTYLVSKGLNK
ncbi:MAG: hypothetical protein P8P74_14155 [Crocinitomicaceae bacterium]|nr:hypothetical protein [Crocinitomicaceae bacterium]